MIRDTSLRWCSAALAIPFAAIALLLAMGRPPICTCGEVLLWGKVGPGAEPDAGGLV